MGPVGHVLCHNDLTGQCFSAFIALLLSPGKKQFKLIVSLTGEIKY